MSAAILTGFFWGPILTEGARRSAGAFLKAPFFVRPEASIYNIMVLSKCNKESMDQHKIEDIKIIFEYVHEEKFESANRNTNANKQKFFVDF